MYCFLRKSWAVRTAPNLNLAARLDFPSNPTTGQVARPIDSDSSPGLSVADVNAAFPVPRSCEIPKWEWPQSLTFLFAKHQSSCQIPP